MLWLVRVDSASVVYRTMKMTRVKMEVKKSSLWRQISVTGAASTLLTHS